MNLQNIALRFLCVSTTNLGATQCSFQNGIHGKQKRGTVYNLLQPLGKVNFIQAFINSSAQN